MLMQNILNLSFFLSLSLSLYIYIYIYIFNNFPDFFVQAFKIVLDS